MTRIPRFDEVQVQQELRAAGAAKIMALANDLDAHVNGVSIAIFKAQLVFELAEYYFMVDEYGQCLKHLASGNPAGVQPISELDKRSWWGTLFFVTT
ncbi:hypothetical protein HK101_003853 [Irineochytrium annulatum]|nr:hypothetical protein HK101_003853 [Irineochytrium annulatum]